MRPGTSRRCATPSCPDRGHPRGGSCLADGLLRPTSSSCDAREDIRLRGGMVTYTLVELCNGRDLPESACRDCRSGDASSAARAPGHFQEESPGIDGERIVDRRDMIPPTKLRRPDHENS